MFFFGSIVGSDNHAPPILGTRADGYLKKKMKKKGAQKGYHLLFLLFNIGGPVELRKRGNYRLYTVCSMIPVLVH